MSFGLGVDATRRPGQGTARSTAFRGLTARAGAMLELGMAIDGVEGPGGNLAAASAAVTRYRPRWKLGAAIASSAGCRSSPAWRPDCGATARPDGGAGRRYAFRSRCLRQSGVGEQWNENAR